jgi:hypothetical protein
MLTVFCLIALFSPRYLWPVALILLGLVIFRATSRNFTKRQAELRKFEIFFSRVSDFLDKMFRPVMNWINKCKSRRDLKKTYKYVKCRYCKKQLRVPKNKGKIKVTCPECKNQFIIKT